MRELRRDPIVGRWVIVETGEPMHPGDFEKDGHTWREGECPFCPGNEVLTPPEIESVRHPDTAANTPGWIVRVIPNKFPALRIEGNLDRRGIGMFDMMNGIGAHEIIIDTPYHYKDLSELEEQEVRHVIDKYCRRSRDLSNDHRFKYALIFKNSGPSAGASLEHPHSQLIALPMVPKNVGEEIEGAKKYFQFRDRCIFCDIINQEKEEKDRIIFETDDFIVFCPFVSRFPFEIEIMPKSHASQFSAMDEDKKTSLAKVLKSTLQRMKKVLANPCYNFIVYTSPLADDNSESYHWHIEIMPKLTRVAGFEWGTGFYVVPTPPELAARYLREA